MNTESSIPIQISQVLSKGKLFDKGKLSLQEEVLDGVRELTSTSVFAPFTEEGLKESEGDSTTERDLLLMEHLPTVRYLARRIHERLPQHVELDDLVSAGVVGLIDLELLEGGCVQMCADSGRR